MEELRVVMEALAKMGDGATDAFIWWCVKEIVVYSFVPITFGFIGVVAFKLVRHWQRYTFDK